MTGAAPAGPTAVLGLGVETRPWIEGLGRAAAASLILVTGDGSVEPAEAERLGLGEVRRDLPAHLELAAIVRSPGWSPYGPEVTHHRAAGVPTTTPLGLWLQARGARPTVAVTGTKGKSSVATVTGSAVRALGGDAVVLGNIGVAAWDLDPATSEVAVVEVSSYQAVDLPVTAPVAALSAVGLDHVDWHGGEAAYRRDKCRVFQAPLAGGDEVARWCGVLDDITLPAPFDEVPFTRVPHPDGGLRARNVRLALATAAAALGVPVEAALEHEAALLADYPQLPARLASLGWVDGVEIIDDALASNPSGVVASLQELGDRPVALVVGGRGRGVDGTVLAAALAAREAPTRVFGVDEADRWADDLAAVGVDLVLAAGLEAALDAALAAVTEGGAVLFSPGMPTPPQQGTWADRSARVAAWVDGHR